MFKKFSQGNGQGFLRFILLMQQATAECAGSSCTPERIVINDVSIVQTSNGDLFSIYYFDWPVKR
jgi:hypothetical protein